MVTDLLLYLIVVCFTIIVCQDAIVGLIVSRHVGMVHNRFGSDRQSLGDPYAELYENNHIICYNL